PALRTFIASSNVLTNVSGLAGFTNLIYLSLADNNLTYVDPVTNLTQLGYVDLRYNLLDTNATSAASMDVAIMQGDHTFVDFIPQRSFLFLPIELLSPARLPGNQFKF